MSYQAKQQTGRRSERRKKDIILLCISVFCFFLMSLTFLVMPIEFPSGKARLFNALIGGAFWLFMLTGIILQIILSGRIGFRKSKNESQIRRARRIKTGVLSFAENPYALAADILCALSIITLILGVILTKGTGYICYAALSASAFTFCMHCILNGRIFEYLRRD